MPLVPLVPLAPSGALWIKNGTSWIRTNVSRAVSWCYTPLYYGPCYGGWFRSTDFWVTPLKGGYEPNAIPLCYSVWHLTFVRATGSIFFSRIGPSGKLNCSVAAIKKGSEPLVFPYSLHRSARFTRVAPHRNSRSQAATTVRLWLTYFSATFYSPAPSLHY